MFTYDADVGCGSGNEGDFGGMLIDIFLRLQLGVQLVQSLL